MRNRPAYLVLAVAVLLATLFIARHGALNALREENDSLRNEIESEKSIRAKAVREPSMNLAAGLNEADEKELLQLRSRIMPLREQLRDTSNRVVILQRLEAKQGHKK